MRRRKPGGVLNMELTGHPSPQRVRGLLQTPSGLLGSEERQHTVFHNVESLKTSSSKPVLGSEGETKTPRGLGFHGNLPLGGASRACSTSLIL